ncbi:Cu(I)-responsive transcriptional regulator [Paenalcaligenes faecalis]|uniref:Cu(I)-responsive transcriptional regulator n=1 Tax=Paenalcaligenes faecalis TaxID=2980099 RepID=UPI0022B9C037|nr:Cu(I)-responsive transcriptional regulator [Paenalcaligenes faecalis]
MKHYTISQAAAHSGLSAKMIRDYEAKGLLPAAIRNDAGYRLYQERDLHTLLFIARARELGFSLKQLEALLALWQDTARSSSQVKQLAESHIAELEEKAKQLHEMAETLRILARQCHGDDRPDCPILRGLEKPLKYTETNN